MWKLITIKEAGSRKRKPIFQAVLACDSLGQASYFAGEMADAMCDRTGKFYDWRISNVNWVSQGEDFSYRVCDYAVEAAEKACA